MVRKENESFLYDARKLTLLKTAKGREAAPGSQTARSAIWVVCFSL